MKYDILIIDDDESLRKMYATLLRNHYPKVATAGSGIKALKLLEKNSYGLILLDLHMPDMAGPDVLKEIRKRDDQVPVFFITAFQDEYLNELKALREAGVEFQILKKPIEKEQLLAVVGRVLPKGLPTINAPVKMRLYVVGKTDRTQITINRLHEIFKNEWEGEYALEVIDALETPDLLEQDHVIATPTLVKFAPGPVKRIIGDLSIGNTVFCALGL